MKRVCTAEQMRNIDRLAIEEGKIPSIVLMENAAIKCMEALLDEFKSVEGFKIGIFCGKGNNAGDGFALARHLERNGANVDVFCLMGYDFTPDAQINFDILKNTLQEKGFFNDTEPHKLVVCGDLMDRGPGSKELEKFIK